MPRLSLYKPERGQDYTFIDRHISEMFQVGGTDIYLHKYLGPKNPSEGTADQPIYNVIKETNIQDLLFLENRDRKYDTEIYRIRGLYNVQNIDFNLSQFGLFIDNDTLFMTVHINDFIKFVGRKPISGDVMELPHLKDEFALNDYDVSLPRYYVIEDVGRASEGFSATWYPHLYRLKLKKIFDSQQYSDILNKPTGADFDKFAGEYLNGTIYYPGQIVRLNGELYQVKTDGSVTASGSSVVAPDPSVWSPYAGNTLENILSTRAKELQINDAVLQQAEADAPKSGYETRQFYTLAVDTSGNPVLKTADEASVDVSNTSYNASSTVARPVRTGYTGYLVGDGFPSNGYDFGHGIQFPESAAQDDYFLRTDFLPNRLFRFDGTRWVKQEDNVRMSMTNNDTRQTQKTGFINNSAYIYNDQIITDYLELLEGTTVIDSSITYTTAPFITLKFETVELDFVVANCPGLLTNNNGKLRVTLPTVGDTQQVIPYSGQWVLGLFNNRVEQRQSLSKALRPRADL